MPSSVSSFSVTKLRPGLQTMTLPLTILIIRMQTSSPLDAEQEIDDQLVKPLVAQPPRRKRLPIDATCFQLAREFRSIWPYRVLAALANLREQRLNAGVGAELLCLVLQDQIGAHTAAREVP